MIVDKVQIASLLAEYPGPRSLTLPPVPYGNAQGMAQGLSSDEVKITCKSCDKNYLQELWQKLPARAMTKTH
jgi:hypothetical protein